MIQLIKKIFLLSIQYWLLTLVLSAIIDIWTTDTNQDLFYIINSWHVYLPDIIWSTLGFIAYSKYFILAIILIVLTYLKRRDKILNTLLVVFLFYTVFYFLKHIVDEPRPYVVLDPYTFYWLNQFENSVSSAYRSFPSGHSGNMSVFVFSLINLFFQKNTIAKILLIGLLILTMLSRICTGWHWPLDVLSGALIGYILVKICYSVSLRRA